MHAFMRCIWRPLIRARCAERILSLRKFVDLNWVRRETSKRKNPRRGRRKRKASEKTHHGSLSIGCGEKSGRGEKLASRKTHSVGVGGRICAKHIFRMHPTIYHRAKAMWWHPRRREASEKTHSGRLLLGYGEKSVCMRENVREKRTLRVLFCFYQIYSFYECKVNQGRRREW